MNISAEDRLQWWREARFGMFIHWGLYAQLAGEWQGQKTPGIGEWIMHDLKIPVAEYEQLAGDFNPVKFDAEKWADIAQQAGMKYLVITAKHHDGFCMFDSPSNPYNIVKQTPFKRDPMKELAEACNKRGIKMCFYYSQAQDWHAEGGAGHWEEESEDKNWLRYARPAEDFQTYLDEVVKPNLRELLTQYGPIGLIWFDTPVAITPEQSASLRDLVHALQPECLVSGRVGHGVGDYGSLGDNQHPLGPAKAAWETPATLNDTWGYKSDDHNWKSLDYLLDLLVNCASKGVNYLLNVGPTAAGEIPCPSVERLLQVGAWLDRNGEAIYGTSASPFPFDQQWGRATCKGSTIYLLVKEWSESSDIRLPGLCNQIRGVRVLGDPDAEVKVSREGDFTKVSLPAKCPEEIVSVIALELDAGPQVEQIVIQDDSAPIELPVHLAETEGPMEVKPQGIIEGWTDPGNRASWTFRVKAPGNYAVKAVAKIHRKRLDLYGTPTLQLHFGDKSLSAKMDHAALDQSEGARIYQYLCTPLGTLQIEEAGDQKLELTADNFDETASRGLSLAKLVLVPA